MNNHELWIKLLVPAIFLILWALNQVFNKEGLPVPGPGPRPGGLPPAPRPPERERRPALEPSTSRRDDDVIIIRSESTRPASPRPRPAPGGASRRSSRSKPSPAATTRRPESGPDRPPAGQVTTGVSQQLGVDLRSLSGLTPEPDRAAAPGDPGRPAVIGVAPTPTAGDLRTVLGDRARLREVFVMNEIFQPPLALRLRRGIGRRDGRGEGEGLGRT